MEDFSFDAFDSYNNTKKTEDNSLIDFRDEKEDVIGKKGYTVDYNDDTINKYKPMRVFGTDPISRERLDKSIPVYRVDKMWDPLTGLFTNEKDPHGPLVFDPVELTKYFYLNRFTHLWKEEEDTGDDLLQECPLEGLGAGEDFLIKGRGYYPEYFIWRIPIRDCYVPKDTPNYIVLKGPKLNRKDIKNIHNLLKKCPKSHINKVFREIPDLVKMYDLYMQAINPKPDLSVLDNIDDPDANNMANILAARQLVDM